MSKDDLTVDDFVQTKVLPELQPIVALIRELMKERAPNAQEVISYGIPDRPEKSRALATEARSVGYLR